MHQHASLWDAIQDIFAMGYIGRGRSSGRLPNIWDFIEDVME